MRGMVKLCRSMAMLAFGIALIAGGHAGAQESVRSAEPGQIQKRIEQIPVAPRPDAQIAPVAPVQEAPVEVEEAPAAEAAVPTEEGAVAEEAAAGEKEPEKTAEKAEKGGEKAAERTEKAGGKEKK